MKLTARLFCLLQYSRFRSVLAGAAIAIAIAIGMTLPVPALAEYKVGDRLAKPPENTPASTVGKAAPSAPGQYKETTWEALIPKDWDPLASLRGLKLDKLKDSDPRAIEALQKLRETWNDAPVEAGMNGAQIRIPGFIIPLEEASKKLSEFLLVPYFGACIHTPPPPSNQVIHVTLSKPVTGFRMMDPVWVSGTLQTGKTDTGMGQAGYQMKAVTVIPYK